MISASGWLRQARHRAKKYSTLSVLTIEQLRLVLAEYENRCAYCGQPAATLDNPVPFADGGVNSQANVLPICQPCKDRKHNHTITWMYNSGHITQEHYVKLVGDLLRRDSDDVMKAVLRRIAGVV